MELSHKRARIELEKAANTNARNYEVSGMSVMAWEHWPRPEHLESIYISGLVWFRNVLWFAVVFRMCVVTLFLE